MELQCGQRYEERYGEQGEPALEIPRIAEKLSLPHEMVSLEHVRSRRAADTTYLTYLFCVSVFCVSCASALSRGVRFFNRMKRYAAALWLIESAVLALLILSGKLGGPQKMAPIVHAAPAALSDAERAWFSAAIHDTPARFEPPRD